MSTPLVTLNALFNGALGTYVFSGYQLVACRGNRSLSLFGGKETGWSGGRSVSAATAFDLGSLTKVVATTSIIARLVESRQITVDKTLSNFLPGLSTRWAGVSLRQLLTHTSGLRGWCAYFETRNADEAFLNWFKRHQGTLAEEEAGVKVIYSDVGFSLLGEVLQALTGKKLDRLFADEVLSPLGLTGIGYGPLKQGVAATEYSLSRDRLLHGEVFDDNTYAMGGVAAQAGLFSSAEALAPFAQAWLDALAGKSSWLSQHTARLFTQKAVDKDRPYALGWDMPSGKLSSAGNQLSRQSFGHLGFTGTSLWIDPERGGYVIFLTNRVHPVRLDERIREIRPTVHNLVVDHWEKANG